MEKQISSIPGKKLIELYETMLKIRLFEEKLIELHPEQLMKSVQHYYIGQEAVAVGVCTSLQKEDHVFSGHRSHGPYIAKGGDLNALMAELHCRVDGCCRGRGGSMHVVDQKVGHMGSFSIVGGYVPLAVGDALSFKIRHKPNVVVVFFGDGAIDEGVVYESMNFAALKKLPVVFICENNFFADYSKASARQASEDIPGKAKAFGVPAIGINGQDVVKVFTTTQEAIKRARDGKGPTLIEAKVFRFKGHCGTGEDIGPNLRTEQELESQKKKCPIIGLGKIMLSNNLLTEESIGLMKKKIQLQINEAVEFGKNSPLPGKEELLKGVFS
jgi:acetoin:2,6-dichlorophenolindophenol oxidoreductase subunit alpha